MSEQVLIGGADVGGTSTTVAATDDGARLVGFACAPGGNVRSSPRLARRAPPPRLARRAPRPGTAVRGARRPAGPGTHGCPRIACSGEARATEVADLARAAWVEAGLPTSVTPTVLTDLEIAFAAGAASADGVLLLAGTGAAARRFADGHLVVRCDGMGWLLGDKGSGVLIGTAALRAVASDLDGRGPATALAGAVQESLAGAVQESLGGSRAGVARPEPCRSRSAGAVNRHLSLRGPISARP